VRSIRELDPTPTFESSSPCNVRALDALGYGGDRDD